MQTAIATNGNAGAALNGGGDADRALPFQVENLEVRGRVVTLGPAINAILARHDYPDPVKALLGEACALAALLATSLKDVSRFILQAQTDGPVSMLVADIRLPGQLRATASCATAAVVALAEAGIADTAALLGTGTLAMTIEQGHGGQRYQGFVPLDHESLEAAAHTYFHQSEQIPTRIRIAVSEMFDRDEDGKARHQWRAGGIIGQFMPEAGDRVRHRDLPAGDAPEDFSGDAVDADDDAWVEAAALIETVEDHELTDPAISPERLLYRLFHERGVRVFKPIRLKDHCSCSRARIERVLDQMDAGEIADAAIGGEIEVRCEFCGLRYHFDPDALHAAASSDNQGQIQDRPLTNL
ncbi:MAG TPA: Hsp33 family molecular chaperone [Afifellaceae bacterium]|nr:Hsp33 family molecular chaperone [Afifellaceae bacterium]